MLGGLLTGVPGEVAGLKALHERFGRLPWRELVLPVAAMARDGFRVSETMARAIQSAQANYGLDQLVNIRYAHTQNSNLWIHYLYTPNTVQVYLYALPVR